MQQKDKSKTKIERAKLDFFLISYSFISGDLIALIAQYNNSDALGWWPVGVVIVSVFGLLFAFIYSLIAMLLNSHRKYTGLFFIMIIVFFMFISVMTHLDSLSIFAQDQVFYGVFFIALILHVGFCIGSLVWKRQRKLKNH